MNRTQVYSPTKAPTDHRGHLDGYSKKSRIEPEENSRQKLKQSRYNNAYYKNNKNAERTSYKSDKGNILPSKTRNKGREYLSSEKRIIHTENNLHAEIYGGRNNRRIAPSFDQDSSLQRNNREVRNGQLIRDNDIKMGSAYPKGQDRHNNFNTPVRQKKSQDYRAWQNQDHSEPHNTRPNPNYSHNFSVQNNFKNGSRMPSHESQKTQSRTHSKNKYSESNIQQKKSNLKKSGNIKSHGYTPEERRMMKAAEAARKTPEEQMLRESRKRQQEKLRLNRVHKKNKRRKSAKNFFSSLLLGIINSIPNFLMFLIVFLSLGIISSLGIFASLHINFSEVPKTIGFNITDTDNTKIYSTSLSAKEYRYGNTIYLNMNDFAKRFGFITVGTAEELKYISGTNENYILNISVGSAEITVNKMQFRLSAPVIRNGDTILVPLEFFKIYLNGISVTFDNEKYAVTMVREIAEYSVTVSDGKTPVYKPVGFIPSVQEPTQNIPEDSLPKDILNATDPTQKPTVTYIDTDGDGIADTAVDSVTGEPISDMNPPSAAG